MAKKQSLPRQFYTLPELKEMWGVSHETLILWSRENIIPSWRPPRARITLVPAQFVEQLSADLIAQWTELWGEKGPGGVLNNESEGENS